MWMLFLLPVAFQGLAMFFDEFYFHWRRGLPLWERLGHPVDTSTAFACYAWIMMRPPTPTNIGVYVGLSLFSCVFVTKDEFEHAKYCESGEHWLHAILFVLHPLVLMAVGMLWPAVHDEATTLPWLAGAHGVRQAVLGQLGLVVAFGTYQLVYWNLIWKPKPLIESVPPSARGRASDRGALGVGTT